MATKYKPSSKGSKQLLNSPQMIAGINKLVTQAKDNAYSMCGGGADVLFVADTRAGKNRAHGMVKTANGAAAAMNSKNNVLLKALGSVRA